MHAHFHASYVLIATKLQPIFSLCLVCESISMCHTNRRHWIIWFGMSRFKTLRLYRIWNKAFTVCFYQNYNWSRKDINSHWVTLYTGYLTVIFEKTWVKNILVDPKEILKTKLADWLLLNRSTGMLPVTNCSLVTQVTTKLTWSIHCGKLWNSSIFLPVLLKSDVSFILFPSHFLPDHCGLSRLHLVLISTQHYLEKVLHTRKEGCY